MLSAAVAIVVLQLLFPANRAHSGSTRRVSPMILSQYTGNAHFYVGGHPQALSFSESIYFSIISISTVGYGDIVPHSSVARLLASIEVVCGFMLLLFGVSELLEYTRERREEDGTRRPPRRWHADRAQAAKR